MFFLFWYFNRLNRITRIFLDKTLGIKPAVESLDIVAVIAQSRVLTAGHFDRGKPSSDVISSNLVVPLVAKKLEHPLDCCSILVCGFLRFALDTKASNIRLYNLVIILFIDHKLRRPLRQVVVLQLVDNHIQDVIGKLRICYRGKPHLHVSDELFFFAHKKIPPLQCEGRHGKIHQYLRVGSHACDCESIMAPFFSMYFYFITKLEQFTRVNFVKDRVAGLEPASLYNPSM